MSNAPLDDLVAAATAAANDAAQHTPAVAPVNATPAVGGTPAGVMSTTALMAASFSPDAWLGVDKSGLTLGKDDKLQTAPIKVSIDLADTKNVTVYRYDNPAKYVKTYDGQHTNTGESWGSKLAEAQAIDPTGQMYGTIDVPMTLLEDVGEMKAGEVLGYSLPVTGREEFLKLLKLVARAGHAVEGLGGVKINTTITAAASK